MRFLNSPAFSLACAVFNSFFAANSYYHGNLLWGALGSLFATICFYNFLKKR